MNEDKNNEFSKQLEIKDMNIDLSHFKDILLKNDRTINNSLL